MKKSTLVIAAAGALALGALLFAFQSLSSAREKAASLKKTREEMRLMQEEVLALRSTVERLEGRQRLTGIKGIGRAVDEVFEPLGLREKVKSVKTIESGSAGEEKAEVKVEGLTLNEAVNAFYSLKNSPMLLIVRKADLKTSFENPERLDVTMTLSLITSQ
jgi:hypothetical protein